MTKTYNLTATNKWISFGGSYPGALSAWVRVKARDSFNSIFCRRLHAMILLSFEDGGRIAMTVVRLKTLTRTMIKIQI